MALRRLFTASQPSCSFVVPYRYMWRRQCIASQFTAEYAWYASSGAMSPIASGVSGASGAPARGAAARPPASSTIAPPIICTVRYTSTWRARPSPTATHASMTGVSNPPEPMPPAV